MAQHNGTKQWHNAETRNQNADGRSIDQPSRHPKQNLNGGNKLGRSGHEDESAALRFTGHCFESRAIEPSV
ncbi:MAG: hypothetical protein BJG00_017805 [Limnothrix sp. CACIAM 69d]|nr:MAG: hypothetical protein BJG00_017805 [Limnothrix sp. CACIAM 69d]